MEPSADEVKETGVLDIIICQAGWGGDVGVGVEVGGWSVESWNQTLIIVQSTSQHSGYNMMGRTKVSQRSGYNVVVRTKVSQRSGYNLAVRTKVRQRSDYNVVVRKKSVNAQATT